MSEMNLEEVKHKTVRCKLKISRKTSKLQDANSKFQKKKVQILSLNYEC